MKCSKCNKNNTIPYKVYSPLEHKDIEIDSEVCPDCEKKEKKRFKIYLVFVLIAISFYLYEIYKWLKHVILILCS